MTISIRAKAAAAAAKAWSMTDAPIAVVIRRPGTITYSTITGKSTTTTGSDYNTDAIVKTYNQNEIDGTKIMSTDRKALIRQAQVASAGTITTTDKFVINGVTKTIVNVGQDAVGTLWILQIR